MSYNRLAGVSALLASSIGAAPWASAASISDREASLNAASRSSFVRRQVALEISSSGQQAQQQQGLHMSSHAEVQHSQMKVCPRDSVEKHYEMPAFLSDGQRSKLEQMASSIELARGAGANLKIGCAFKMVSNEKQRMVDTIQTWAHKCDQIYAFSDEAWQLPGPWGVSTIVVNPIGGNSYRNLWHKTQAIMQALPKLWQRDSLDFVVMSDTDTFFVMENLRDLLSSSSVQANQAAGKPILFGDVWGQPGAAWVSGGGYVINRAVVDAVNSCPQNIKDEITPAEDVKTCECLRQSPSHFEVYDEGQACDSDRRDRFEHRGILNLDLDAVSKHLIMFHHTVAEERYHFYRALYRDQAERICVQDTGSMLVGEGTELSLNNKDDAATDRDRIILGERAPTSGIPCK